MSGCIVQDYDDGEMLEAMTEKLVRGRKAYRCCECGETIGQGDLHQVIKGVCDGSWETWRTCARCVNVWTDYFVGSRTLGTMLDDFEYEHGVDYRDGIPAHITPCAEAPR